MKKSGQNITGNWKRRVTQFVALLFVLYAFADATVLQGYCGNEAVGIPPAHHLPNQAESLQVKKSNSAEIKQTDSREPQDDRETSRTCDDECLGCCTHVALGFFIIEPRIFTYLQKDTISFSYENKYSNSNLSHLFRPPRIA